jgi:prepilin-type N-terminal cleavage/methylation domain-containing protein
MQQEHNPLGGVQQHGALKRFWSDTCGPNVDHFISGRDLNHLTNTGSRGKIKTSKQRGFSLIELLIVVAIILIIAAIAIPNLLRARMASNESSAVASIRTINTGMVTYNSTYPTVGYAAGLTNPGGVAPCTPSSTTACLIDSVLAAGTKSGYTFTATGAGGPPAIQYFATAVPITPNQTGIAVSVRSKMRSCGLTPLERCPPTKPLARPCCP